MNNDITKKVFDKIDKDNITPKSKIIFLLREKIMWGIGVILLFFGGISVSVIIHSISTGDFDIYRYTNSGFFDVLIILIPYFWLIMLLMFGLFIYLDIRKTKTGYRYTFLYITSSVLIISILLGILFYFFGIGKKFEHMCSKNIHTYQKISCFQENMLHNPSNGILIGDVISFSKESSKFIIKDVYGAMWDVLIQNQLDEKNENSFIGLKIKIIGKVISQNTFVATQIRPMRCGCCECDMIKEGKEGGGCHMTK